MSKYNKTVLTNAGIELVRRVNAGKAKFSITKCATSSENLSNKSITELQELTELPSIMQYGEIADITDSAQDKDTVIGALLKFNNKGLKNGYNINTLGLYAKEEGADQEFLYAVATTIDPERMPDFTDKAMFQFNVTVYVVVGQTSNVTVNVTEDGVATKKDLVGLKGEVDKKADKTDVTTQVSDAVTKAKKYTDDQAKTKVDVDTFNTALKAKANKDEVNSDLAGKVDKTEFTTFKDTNDKKLNAKVENIEFTKFKTDNQKVLDTKLDKATYENDIKQVGKVKSASINGSEKISPDATGNLDLKVDIPVTSANGQKGDVQIPVFAPNLLTGTSDELQTIGGNGLLSDKSVSIKTGEKYTLNAWIDNTKGNSGDDKVSIWYLDNTGKAITMSSGNAISDGRAGYSSVTVIFTNSNVVKITAHISGGAVPVKEAKLAKWQDTNTPPDMTWLPNSDDANQYTNDNVDKLPKTVNKKAPDTTGNIDITASDTGAYSKVQTDTELAKKVSTTDFNSFKTTNSNNLASKAPKTDIDNLSSQFDKLPNTYQTKSAASSQYNSLSNDITAVQNRAVTAENNSKSYTDNRISGISIPNMNNYYTISQADSKVNAAVRTKAEQSDLNSVKVTADKAYKETINNYDKIVVNSNRIAKALMDIQNMQKTIDSLKS
ncbi:hypothetical protein [Lactobacillus sp. ESL0681]|uniref:hypothetical protein n=1 Tax=Lactobacillus sp. ESL0681 TaxID=2983211 RepID=UPI0023F6EBF2|nr:hypothetical protein [Lactobacillus sp. ESL0681]WEV40369.1 hypothetical protein OZX59_00180 [Lactobacillus sp. ESL0681]